MVGFVVDAASVHFLVQAHWGLLSAQAAAFFCALTCTWILNRKFTFHAKNQRLVHEWLRYAAANSTGGIANNGVYALLVWRSPTFAQNPLLAVAAGSVAGLVFNFTATRALVYRRSDSGRRT